MIFTAADFNAIRCPDRTVRIFPGGWVSDGTFALLVGDDSAVHGTRHEAGSPPHERFLTLFKATRVAAAERRGWRLPGWPRRPGPPCPRCDGKGELTCDLDEQHECPRCRGKGELRGGKAEQLGQIIIDSAGGRLVVIAGRFAPLVDKATSLVSLAESRVTHGEDVIGALDEKGDVHAFVMPLVHVDITAPPGLVAEVRP